MQYFQTGGFLGDPPRTVKNKIIKIRLNTVPTELKLTRILETFIK